MKSNLLKKAALASMVGAFITPMAINVTASADSTSSSDVQQQLDKDNISSLQKDIDNNVQVDNNGNYVYSPSRIKSIVYSYNFDKINKNSKTNYSKESFFEQANNSLSTTNVKNKSPFYSLAAYSGVNKTVDHWNYTRVYRNHSNTAKTAMKYSNTAANWGALGGTSAGLGLFGIYGAAAGVAVGTTSAGESWYWSQFANALNANNNSHGTKSDVNKFDAQFTVNPQN